MSDLYCSAPWRGLHITTSGDVKPCCSGAHGFGNINDKNIVDIVNNSEWTQLRSQIMQGSVPEYCSFCVRQGDSKGTERQWHNSMGPLVEPGPEYQSPSILDVRWSNACNLMCIYCNPHDSSLWARKLNYPLLTKRKEYYSDVVNFVQNNQENLRSVALIGGEPLLIPQCNELLEVIPQDVEIDIITNLSIDLTDNKVFDTLCAKSDVRWSVSFENIGSQFEYVRRGAKWNQFAQNLKILQGLPHSLNIHAVLNIFSLASFDQLVDFALENKIKIVTQFLENPSVLDLRLFPEHVVKTIEQRVVKRLETVSDNWCNSTAVLEYFNSSRQPVTGQIDKFYQYIQEWDTAELQFANLWPELDKQLKTCYNS